MTFPANPNPSATAFLIVDPASGSGPKSKPTLVQVWHRMDGRWRARTWRPIPHPDTWGAGLPGVIRGLQGATVIIEAGLPGVRGGGDTSAMLGLERVRGVIEGVARSAGCPVVYLPPHEWRKQLGLKNQPKTKTRKGVKAEKQMADMCEARAAIPGPLQEWYRKAFRWPRTDGKAPEAADRRACLLMAAAVCDAWGLGLGGGGA